MQQPILAFLTVLALLLSGCASSPASPSGDLRYEIDAATYSAPSAAYAQGTPAPYPPPYPPAYPPPYPPQYGAPPPRAPSGRPEWRKGSAWTQGYIGVGETDATSVSQSGNATVEVDDADYPFIGGGAQWKIGGDRIDWGIEGLFSLAWNANATALYFGGGGAAVAVDVDTLLIDLSAGPFASLFLGDKVRVYAGAGPSIQFLNYHQHVDLGGGYDSGSGFGTGLYARTGIEFLLANRSLLGVGARWTDGEVDLDGGLGDFETEGYQFYVTVTTAF